MTTIKAQAERWARRKALLANKAHGYVSIYEMAEKSRFHIIDFKEDLEIWLRFVCACRDGADIYKQYDIIRGKVADDKVFRVVDMFKRGIWDVNRAIEEIRIYETFEQIAFISQEAIDALLSFKGSYEV